MDDGEFDRGKDSAQQRDATNLPLACLPTAYGRFLSVVKGQESAHNGPEFALILP